MARGSANAPLSASSTPRTPHPTAHRLCAVAAAGAWLCAALLHTHPATAWAQTAPADASAAPPPASTAAYASSEPGADPAPTATARRSPFAPPPQPQPGELRPSTGVSGVVPAPYRRQLPTFLLGDRLTGQMGGAVALEGNTELRRLGTVIRANTLSYDSTTDRAKAQGGVRVNQQGNVFEGTVLDVRVDDFTGFFNDPSYSFIRYGSKGQADRVEFLSQSHAIIRNATYTTCDCPDNLPSWAPAWMLRAKSLEIDEDNDTGTARGGSFAFKGATLPLPDFSFPLGDKRRSGWLPPTMGLDTAGGFTLAQPYYWDIAPNRDATFTPTLLSKRGLKVDTEFRYLEPTYRGTARFDLMPTDSLRNRLRWGAAVNHTQTIESPWSSPTGMGLNVNLNRVSDADYWRDFPRSGNSFAQRLLPNDVNLSWAGESLSWMVRTQRWQTLQNTGSTIMPPYDRWPQVLGRYQRNNWRGFDLGVDAESTQFVADRTLTGQPNAWRSHTKVYASYPWQTPGWYVTPKAQLHSTWYQLDAPLIDGRTSVLRQVPTFSLDSGLTFEKPLTLWGRNLTQTLEPRALYVYTPFRDQATLPLYDTGLADFNFATIFSDNPYIGNDRIADNSLLTLGATSRFLDNASGGELMKFAFAQRLRLRDQRVTLRPTDPVVNERVGDQLMGVSLNWNPQWAFESTFQYNQKDQVSKRGTVGTRYHPSAYRTVSAVYRMQRDVSEQLDLGWQWPLNDLWGDRGQDLGPGRGQGEGRWYTVGRLNYALREKRFIDTLLGLEYDAGCWLGRVVVSRLQTGAVAVGGGTTTVPTSAATSISFQLEFVGLSRVGVGANPLRLFKQNVPRFEYLRETQPAPSPLSNYE